MRTLSEYYPIMVRLENKRCVVIGGGRVATRKIKSLIAAKANVIVISPTITDEISKWVDEHHVQLIEREFDKQDVNGAFLVIAATNHPEVNLTIYHSSHSDRLINIVDQPELSNFIVPTVFNRGKLAITISTSGSSPLLAKKIKSDLEEIYDEAYESYLDFLEDCRKKIKVTVKDIEKRIILYKLLLNPIYLRLTREGNLNERSERFENELDNYGGNHEDR